MKTITINQDILNLATAARRTKSPGNLTAVHFNGSKIYATDGHIAAIMSKPEKMSLPENLPIDLSGVKIPKKQAVIKLFPVTASGDGAVSGYKHAGGIAPVLEGQSPNIDQVIPTVSTDTHIAVTLNPDLLARLAVAMRGKVNPTAENPMITLLINRTDNLDCIGVVCGNETIGLIMPGKGWEATCAAMERFNRIGGKTQAVAVEAVEAETAGE